jgi:predicted GNAT superfamily acetyltransferase
MNDIEVRLLASDTSSAMEEIHQCVELQKDVKWYSEIVPPHIFRADSIDLVDNAIRLGYVLVALNKNSNRLAGFARVTFTAHPDKHWLHEIVVSQEEQSRNIGLEIMKKMKDISIDLGAKEIYFTYDPFEGHNGRLYLTKCGAKATKVYENLYGEIKSPAHGNRKTHRFLVCWSLSSDRPLVEETLNLEEIPIIDSLPFSDLPRVRIEIPYKIQALSEEDAARWQKVALPLLVEAINRKSYKAVYLQTKKDECRNFLVLEI